MYKNVVPSAIVTYLQQQGNGKLGNRIGAVTGHIADRDAMPSGAVHIHNVVSRGQHADHADRGTGFNDRSGEGSLVYKNDLAVADTGNALFVGIGAVIDGYLTPRGKDVPVQIAGIDGKTIQNSDFHIAASLKCGRLFDRIRKNMGVMLWN